MLKNTSEVTGEETPLIGWVDAVINFVQSHRRINAVDTDKHILTNQCILVYGWFSNPTDRESSFKVMNKLSSSNINRLFVQLSLVFNNII